MINANIPTPPKDGACKLYSVRGELVWVKEKKGDEGMLSHYSRIQYIKDWNNGIHNELTFKAKTTNDREWRKVASSYLIDDMLEKVKGHEEDERVLSLSSFLPLIMCGMAYVVVKNLAKACDEKMKSWDIYQWFIAALEVIDSESNYVEGSDAVETESVETNETTNVSDDTEVIE